MRISSTRKKNIMLVIACGKAKIWDKSPRTGRIAAKDAYTSSLFKLCRQYAEKHHDDAWVILSARYGFLRPETLISRYDTTFLSGGATVSTRTLKRQWRKSFPGVGRVTTLAGREYVTRLLNSLPHDVEVHQPLEGLGLFARLSWLKRRL